MSKSKNMSLSHFWYSFGSKLVLAEGVSLMRVTATFSDRCGLQKRLDRASHPVQAWPASLRRPDGRCHSEFGGSR
jgi:hypothetical protein